MSQGLFPHFTDENTETEPALKSALLPHADILPWRYTFQYSRVQMLSHLALEGKERP